MWDAQHNVLDNDEKREIYEIGEHTLGKPFRFSLPTMLRPYAPDADPWNPRSSGGQLLASALLFAMVSLASHSERRSNWSICLQVVGGRRGAAGAQRLACSADS